MENSDWKGKGCYGRKGDGTCVGLWDMLSSLFGTWLQDAGWLGCQQRMCARQEGEARFVGIICSSGTLFTFHKDAGEVVNNFPLGTLGRDERNSFQRKLNFSS